MSSTITEGIRVQVVSSYVAHQSIPARNRFAFSYTVTIANEGEKAAQLRSRHWIITDASGVTQEVRGEGVVGEQPVLKPQQRFRYTSGCILKTPWGTMNGSYQMFRSDGSSFDAEIAPFLLTTPFVMPSTLPS